MHPYHLRCLPLPSPLSLFLIVIVLFPLSLFFIFIFIRSSFFPLCFRPAGVLSPVFPPHLERLWWKGIQVGKERQKRWWLRIGCAQRPQGSRFPSLALPGSRWKNAGCWGSAAGVRLLTMLHKASPHFPNLPRRWRGRDCTCGPRTQALRCQSKPVRDPLTSVRPRQLPRKPSSKGGCSSGRSRAPRPVQLGEGSQPGSQEGHRVSGSRPLLGAPFPTA